MNLINFLRFFLAALFVAFVGAVYAQKSEPLFLGVNPRSFKCVVMMFDLEFRNGGPYIGEWKGDLFFFETKMLGIGPIFLKRGQGSFASKVYAPTRVDAKCDSMKIEFERVEKKLPHAVAALTPVIPVEGINVDFELLLNKERGEFAKNNLMVKISGDDFVMYRADEFLKSAGDRNLKASDLSEMTREFCEIVNGTGSYANLIDECVVRTKGQ